MEQFVIEGGHELNGTITASGNKNAALKMIPACLLTDEPVILHNVPDILDVHVVCDIVRSLGASVEWVEPGVLRLHAKEITAHEIDRRNAQSIRASIVLAGPMLAREGQLILPPPGGDVIGRRRLDTHMLALQRLGAQITYDRDHFRMRAKRMIGANILLDEASVTATENTLMAAVTAEGTTVIRNAASEPHVQDLCHMLNAMGAQIEGIGSNVLTVHGVDKLHGAEARVGADYLEVGSFIGAAAVTGGQVTIKHADPHYLDMIALVFDRLGVRWHTEGQDITIPRGQPLTIAPDIGDRVPEIKAQPWPAFPSDLMSIALVVATQAAGTVLFHEWMYDSRFFFVDKLVYMGARIILCDPHRVIVQGPARLHGEPERITSPDIRAGIALVLAALCAEGVTVIRNVGQIDRGYEDIEGKLRALGAVIDRQTVD
ncbi:MAG: UDP-N-acetylglucosamine 1-carboxyvinyltransferase [Anaerolineae bacterium]